MPGVTIPRNRVVCERFSPQVFGALVTQASAARDGAPPNTQTEYLARYLAALDAGWLVVEQHYIDRHFIEELGLYYSRRLAQPPNYCCRLHAFTNAYDAGRLGADLEAAANSEPDQLHDAMQSAYLGYVVIRPLSAAPIGRTWLRPPQHLATACFPVQSTGRLHFLGLPLEVRGLPFQQQDQAVGACATTALWTTLQRLSRHEGARAPTPSAIAEAAVRHVALARPYPSPGLIVSQMCEALRSYDFPPIVLAVAGEPQYFRLLLHLYVASGIPVVLVLSSEGRKHAVTVCGYRRDSAETVDRDGARFDSANLAFDRLFIHDDRLGPYVEATLSEQISTDGRGQLWLAIPFPDSEERSQIDQMLVPLYPKLRSSGNDLMVASLGLYPVVQALSPDARVGLDLRFERCGDYLYSLYRKQLEPRRLARFQTTAALSRYVGLASWSLDGQPVLECVWDTTDITRTDDDLSQLLALVVRDSRFADDIAVLAGNLDTLSC